jgi:hypothetical protein
MNKYTITVTESAAGTFAVTDVQKVVKINQHRTDTKRMARDAFGFATASDPQSLAKRAARRSR